MKRTLKTIAICVTISITSVSCDLEDLVNSNSSRISALENNSNSSSSFSGTIDRDAFLNGRNVNPGVQSTPFGTYISNNSTLNVFDLMFALFLNIGYLI